MVKYGNFKEEITSIIITFNNIFLNYLHMQYLKEIIIQIYGCYSLIYE